MEEDNEESESKAGNKEIPKASSLAQVRAEIEHCWHKLHPKARCRPGCLVECNRTHSSSLGQIEIFRGQANFEAPPPLEMNANFHGNFARVPGKEKHDQK